MDCVNGCEEDWDTHCSNCGACFGGCEVEWCGECSGCTQCCYCESVEEEFDSKKNFLQVEAERMLFDPARNKP